MFKDNTARAVQKPASLPTLATPPDRTAWDRAFDAHRLAEAEESAFAPLFDCLHDKWRASVDAVPHVVLRPDPFTGKADPVSTADALFVTRARKFVADIDAGKARIDPLPSLQEHLALCRDVVAAADQRDQHLEAIAERLDYNNAANHYESLGDRTHDTLWALMDMPAPDLPALRWKLEYLLQDDSTGSIAAWSADALAQTRADVAQHLGGEA